MNRRENEQLENAPQISTYSRFGGRPSPHEYIFFWLLLERVPLASFRYRLRYIFCVTSSLCCYKLIFPLSDSIIAEINKTCSFRRTLLITSRHSIYNKETSMKRQITSRKNGGQTKRRLKIGCQCNRLLNNKQNVSSLLQTFMFGFYLPPVIYNKWRSALSTRKISIFLWDVKSINCHIRWCMSLFILRTLKVRLLSS